MREWVSRLKPLLRFPFPWSAFMRDSVFASAVFAAEAAPTFPFPRSAFIREWMFAAEAAPTALP